MGPGAMELIHIFVVGCFFVGAILTIVVLAKRKQ